MNSKVFIHGGFEPKTPNIPTDLISVIDCCKLFKNIPHLLPKNTIEDIKINNQQIDHSKVNNNTHIPQSDQNDRNIYTPNITNDINCEVKMSESCFIVNINDEIDKAKKVPLSTLPEESKRIGENYEIVNIEDTHSNKL